MKAKAQPKPGILVRGAVKAIAKLTGHQYVRLPFTAPRACVICGYEGPFRHSGLYNIRPDALCKSCWSTDRDRLMALYLQRTGWEEGSKEILHFAPEPVLRPIVERFASRYVTADLFVKGVDVAWDIEKIDTGEGSFDAVMCNHVLEHVDTARALGEMFRILRPGGAALLMVPIEEGLETTYVNDAVTTDEGRYLHFMQPDHQRVIGRDFRDEVLRAGFELEEFTATGEEIVRHGLRFGERVFIGRKPG